MLRLLQIDQRVYVLLQWCMQHSFVSATLFSSDEQFFYEHALCASCRLVAFSFVYSELIVVTCACSSSLNHFALSMFFIV